MQDVKRFEGTFMVFCLKNGRNISRRIAGRPLPWFHHHTLDAAETEAKRLNEAHPGSTFAVMQMVSRVKQVADPAQDMGQAA